MYRVDSSDRIGAGDTGGVEAAAYVERARRLKLPFTETAHLGPIRQFNGDAFRRGSFAMAADGTAYLAPDEWEISSIKAWLAAHPEARGRLWVTTPRAIRAALASACAPQLLDQAVNGLAGRRPELSAQRTLTPAQVVFGVVALTAIAAGIVLAPHETAMIVNLAAAFLFLSVSALRFIAAGLVGRQAQSSPASTAQESDTPTYTVLAPLYHEANLADDVVRALLKLDWPSEKLDVKLLVEAGDRATTEAVRRAIRGTPFEVVVVPEGAPRTKPRALAYALPLARGEFVTVFDAEDRPHPLQLRQAWQTFRRASGDVACVQAALVVDNEADGWLPLLFAIEYAALFDGLLPALAKLKMPVPLGGTSNHFRRRVLDEIGGWDCYNVTEDADLGIRLARFGYRTAMIDAPTFEDAPTRGGVWFRQRTRWFKGWLRRFKGGLEMADNSHLYGVFA